jgi:hypothetical protein
MYHKAYVGDSISVRAENGKYFDAIVTEVTRKTYWYKAVGDTVQYDIDKLDPYVGHPLTPSVTKRFQFFEKLVRLALLKKNKAILVTGEGGLGKSWSLNNVIEELSLEENEDYVRLNGSITPRGLYDYLRENWNKTVILEDADDVWKDQRGLNVLKAVLDTTAKIRKVSWVTSVRGGEKITFFAFTGSVIFLTNIPKAKLNQALVSRTKVIDLYMTADEKIQRMQDILPMIEVEEPLYISEYHKQQVLEMVAKFRHTVQSLTIRTLSKAIETYAQTEDWDLVQYQILNS